MHTFFPRNLPPSQGGKYAGFGNTAYVQPTKNSSTEVYDSLATVIKKHE